MIEGLSKEAQAAYQQLKQDRTNKSEYENTEYET